QQRQVFIDGTFRVIASTFFQCVVIVAFEDVIFTFDWLFLEKCRSLEFLQLSATLVCKNMKTAFEPKMWNLYDISEPDIWRQTNNYLEHYNRHFIEQFANAYPKIVAFISGIQKIIFDYTIRAKSIYSGSMFLKFDATSIEKPIIPNRYTQLLKQIFEA
ncbi:hypothetical protein MXB_3725, partial [Myxobolus squamalis]